MQTAEVYAGDGYLSQSSADVLWGLPNGRRPLSIDIRRPDSKSTTTAPEVEKLLWIVEQPR